MIKYDDMSREDLIRLVTKQQERIDKLNRGSKRGNYKTKINDDILVDMYLNRNMSLYQISKDTGYAWGTIKYRLTKLGVYVGENK